jgi:hypothetical protein
MWPRDWLDYHKYILIVHYYELIRENSRNIEIRHNNR